MKIAIVEDEKIARENLKNLLNTCEPDASIEIELSSINEAVNWFNRNYQIDLAFFDIQLNDGISFDIFENCNVNCPIVFITAYDDYLMRAFKHHGIDYIVKPLNIEKLKEALNKYNQLKQYFQPNSSTDYKYILNTIKNRLIVHKGLYDFALETNKIAFIQSENKHTFIVTKDGTRYLADHNLSELEDILDHKTFFRANRQFIINIEAIAKFKPYTKGKIILDITPSINQEIIISQENASKFKQWISN